MVLRRPILMAFTVLERRPPVRPVAPAGEGNQTANDAGNVAHQPGVIMNQRAARLALPERDDREALLTTSEYVAVVLAQAPPLTADQVWRLRQLLKVPGEPLAARRRMRAL